MTGSWIPEDPFDDIFHRFFGSSGRPQPPVQRVDLGRLLNDDAKQLVSLGRQAAVDWGHSAITPEHLLYVAALTDPTRGVISGLGLDPDKVAEQMRDVVAASSTADEDGPVTLSPAAKLALRTAQQQASQAGVSYIGPEHILLGIASNPDSPAAGALSGAKIDAGNGTPAKSSTPTLDEYGRDLTAEARGGNIDPSWGGRTRLRRPSRFCLAAARTTRFSSATRASGRPPSWRGSRSASSTATCRPPSPTAGWSPSM